MADNKGVLRPRAYARLLTMIGDQLIKNEKVALIELIKNSYDADANWVQIRFNNFDINDDKERTLIKRPDSSIEIEDDGTGMSFEIIETVWLNPATPNKYIQKNKGENRTKIKKRLIQGEKGIGRFAVYKLGSTIELITRSNLASEKEVYLINDLSSFDDEVITDIPGQDAPKYLDQIEYLYEKRNKPKDIYEKTVLIQNKKEKRLPHGTLIKVSNLRGEWSIEKIESILLDLSKLNSPFSLKKKDVFVCEILVNNETQFNEDRDYKSELEILRDKAPVRITNGKYDGSRNIKFELNNSEISISIERLLENKEFRKRFAAPDQRTIKRLPECGPFDFQFHIYDFTAQAPVKYRLLTDEKEIIRNNRIYLYRDGIRVFPYGDKNDDWLEIDILRGTGRAGDYLSNDQTVGFIGISAEKNPHLKDKTNREGLLEIGNAFEDFKVLIQSILGYLHKEFKKYKISLEQKDKVIALKESITQNQFESFKKYLKEKSDAKGLKVFDVIQKNYLNEKRYLIDRAEMTEDLAAVGISVEAASHDLMMMMHRANQTLGLLLEMAKYKDIDIAKLSEALRKLNGQIKFIESQIEGIQPIFRSSKRQVKEHKIIDVIKNVLVYFESLMEENGIELVIEEKQKGYSVSCNEAVLLQTFINLFDNAVYWLKTVDTKNKQIKILIDKPNKQVIFSDSGPGINSDDIPFIFEPFFSTKGMQGRGLGLYIASQLLQRHDFKISYVTNPKNRILPGANFLIDFKN
jgi:hypothetical protein